MSSNPNCQFSNFNFSIFKCRKKVIVKLSLKLRVSHYIVPRTIECRFQQRCRKYKNVSNDQLWLFFNNTIISYVLNRFPITTYSVQHTEEIRSIKSRLHDLIKTYHLVSWPYETNVVQKLSVVQYDMDHMEGVS